MRVLGISCFFHDAAAALLSDGQLVAAAQEERFSRVRHDARFPTRAIRFCLSSLGISAPDLDYVVFYEKPIVKFGRILLSTLATFPASRPVYVRSMAIWLSDRLWMRDRITRELDVPRERILFTRHHDAHAASSFLCSGFDRAAVLVLDGVGESATTTLAEYSQGPEGAGHRTLREIHFPHSLGLLYATLTAYLGFEVNEGEYKVMGLAAYGQPRYREALERVVRRADDGSFALDMRYFRFAQSTTRSFSGRLAELLGPPRSPDAPLHPERADDAEARRFADIAASLQELAEELVLGLARELHRLTGQERLCLAGGVALNGRITQRLLDETPFREVYVQPAAGDAGAALGAALYVDRVGLRRPGQLHLRHAARGQAFASHQVADYLAAEGVPHATFDDEERLLEHTARLISQGSIVGWLQGRFEWGPRALGQRSILADPRSAAMRDVVNRHVKFRESFRPIAPAVLAERYERYFPSSGAKAIPDPARFMLLVPRVRPEAVEDIRAAVHVDGTSRPQAVFAEESPRFHRLLAAFERTTGVGALLNTSMNVAGSPIVNTPAEGLALLRSGSLDALVMQDCVIRAAARTMTEHGTRNA